MRDQGRLGRSEFRAVWINGEKLPCPRDPFQLVSAAFRESDTRPDNEISKGTGDDNFASTGRRHDSSGDMDGDSTDIVANELTLSRVNPGADLYSQCLGVGA